jgi:hypothetical protein
VRQATDLQKERRPAAEVMGDGFAKCRGGRGVGLSDRSGAGSWARRTAGWGALLVALWLACSPLFLVRPAPEAGANLCGTFLVPTPIGASRRAARSPRLGPKRSGAPRLGGVDRMSRGSCYASIERSCFATGMEARKGGDAGRCVGGSVHESPAGGGSPQGLPGGLMGDWRKGVDSASLIAQRGAF